MSNKISIKKFIIGIIFFFLVGLVFYLQSTGKISLNEIINLIRSLGPFGIFIFILIYAIGTLFAFPGSILTLAAGFLYNTFIGFIVVVIGATIGALLSYITAKYLFHDYFQERFGNIRVLKSLKTTNQKNLSKSSFILRLLPIVPFNALNYCLGLTKINAKNFTLTTFFGIMPGTFIYVFLGSSLNDIFSIKFIIALTLFIAFTVIITLISKKYNKKNG